MSLSVSAFAATITISRDETYEAGSEGARTYTAYKVFDAVYNTLSGSNTQEDKDPIEYTPANAPVAYSMATDSPWLTAMQASGQTWFDVKLAADGSKYVVTLKNGVDNNAATAKAIAAYLAANLPSGLTGTPITPGTAATVDEGYYLILASDGATNLTLVTTDVTIVEKNTYLYTKKETEETSYSVGDIINYTATVDIPADTALTESKPESEGGGYKDGHGPIILHDVMNSVLAFDSASVKATLDGAAFTGFTLTSSGLTDGCTFEITIPVTENLLGKSIIFTYSAELTSAAVNPDTGFINKLFGEKNGYKTVPDQPIVYTFDFDFSKEFVGSTDNTLKATFELCTTADGKLPVPADAPEGTEAASSAIKLIAGTAAGSYIVADSNDTNTTTIIESANNAAINVQGLKAGTYYLIEKSTSTGFNMLDGAVTVVITDTTPKDEQDNITGTPSHTVTVSGNPSTADAPAKIQNNSGTVLPSTGGIGTTIFYVVGSILVVAAGVLLITKKRMSREG